MNGNSKKCQSLLKAKKYKSNFPASTIGKNPNEKIINTIIESKIGPIMDLECFFDLPLGFAIFECNI